MDKSKSVENSNVDQQSNTKSKTLSLFSSLVREALAIFFWVYVIVKLFIFDIDIFLVETLSPNYIWLINYKFFILIGAIAIIWLVTKNRHMVLWSLFIIFYPLIVFLWKIPVLLFKTRSWNFAFAYVDSIISFFKSLRITFITASFFLVSTAIIFGFSNTVLLWFSIAVLNVIILLVYLQRIVLVLKPSGIYEVYSKIFADVGNHWRKTFGQALDEGAIKLPIESMEEKHLEKLVSNLQQLVLFNRVCLFVAKGLKSYQESGFNWVSSIFSILLLVLYTVFSFAVINFGLFKIDPHLYSFSNMPTFFNFFYYSYNILLFNPIQEVVATTPLSQVVLMVESFYALFLVAILVSLVLSVRSQKYTDELNEAIKNLTEEGILIERHIKNQYKVENIDTAMELLRKLKSTTIELLNKITESIA